MRCSEAAISEVGEQDIFAGGSRDQVMLFTRPPPNPSSLPIFVTRLIGDVSELLRPLVPCEAHTTAFEQDLARQVILNLYPPGQGISPHIDLPNRYADGIAGVSLMGGCVMTFRKAELRHDVYLPERSVYVLTGEARWEWSHGIEGRTEDLVMRDSGVETKLRSTRVSLTFRWMQTGADTLS